MSFFSSLMPGEINLQTYIEPNIGNVLFEFKSGGDYVRSPKLEKAYWFYEDYFISENPDLQHFSFREFALNYFKYCSLLNDTIIDHTQAMKGFIEYRSRVPVCGAIIFNKGMDKVLLVRGYKAGSSWHYPRGKINKEESCMSCAIREIYEEVGIDISLYIKEDEYCDFQFNKQYTRLYFVHGVPEDTKFTPNTKKEIKDIMWHSLVNIPGWSKTDSSQNLGVSSNKYFLVSKFFLPIREHVKRKENKHKATIDESKTVTIKRHGLSTTLSAHKTNSSDTNLSKDSTKIEEVDDEDYKIIDESYLKGCIQKNKSLTNNSRKKSTISGHKLVATDYDAVGCTQKNMANITDSVINVLLNSSTLGNNLPKNTNVVKPHDTSCYISGTTLKDSEESKCVILPSLTKKTEDVNSSVEGIGVKKLQTDNNIKASGPETHIQRQSMINYDQPTKDNSFTVTLSPRSTTSVKDYGIKISSNRASTSKKTLEPVSTFPPFQLLRMPHSLEPYYPELRAETKIVNDKLQDASINTNASGYEPILLSPNDVFGDSRISQDEVTFQLNKHTVIVSDGNTQNKKPYTKASIRGLPRDREYPQNLNNVLNKNRACKSEINLKPGKRAVTVQDSCNWDKNSQKKHSSLDFPQNNEPSQDDASLSCKKSLSEVSTQSHSPVNLENYHTLHSSTRKFPEKKSPQNSLVSSPPAIDWTIDICKIMKAYDG